MKKYILIWLKLCFLSFQIALSSRFGAILFLFGKIIRFGFFLIFLSLLAAKTKNIAGFSLWQIIFFFATFNLIDSLTQFFLREVYRFRSYVVSGNFDLILTKPISPLFRSLFGGSDILDVPMLALSLGFMFIAGSNLPYFSLLNILLFILLFFNAMLIACAFHILVLSIGVLTTEVDNTIMLYRDITQMGRLPVDIYKAPVGSILTFVIPVGIMMTFPAKALMGVLSFQFILIALVVGIVFLFSTVRLWKFALTKYSSASS